MAKKVTGVPKKIPKNEKKMAKNGPTEPRVISLKRVRMHCKCQKRVNKGSKMIPKMGLKQA